MSKKTRKAVISKTVTKVKRRLSWRGCPSECTYQGFLEITDQAGTAQYVVLEWMHPGTGKLEDRTFLIRKDMNIDYAVEISPAKEPLERATGKCDCPAGKRKRAKECRHVAALIRLIERGRL